MFEICQQLTADRGGGVFQGARHLGRIRKRHDLMKAKRSVSERSSAWFSLKIF